MFITKTNYLCIKITLHLIHIPLLRKPHPLSPLVPLYQPEIPILPCVPQLHPHTPLLLPTRALAPPPRTPPNRKT